MKIGFVLDDTLDKTDGVQQYVLLLGKWLATQGHEVHYLVGESRRTDLPHLHSLSRNVAVQFNQNKLSIPLPASRRKIAELLEREQFDVLHIQMPYSPFLAGRIIRAAGRGTAIVGTFHILPFSRFEFWATKLLGRVLRPSLKKFSRVVAVSGKAADFARQSFGVDAQVIPNAVDVQAFRARPQNKPSKAPFTVAFLGRLVPRKGAMELLHAIAALPEATRQNLLVKIGGKGHLAAELQTYVSAHGLEKVVRFDGFIAEEDKPAFLGSADIAIFPSLGGESFGIVLVEGMAAGAGVTMGGDNPGYRSVLGGWPDVLFDPRDAQGFSRQLQRLIGDTGLRQRIHEQQQKAVEAYDVAVVGAKIQELYAAALRTIHNVR